MRPEVITEGVQPKAITKTHPPINRKNYWILIGIIPTLLLSALMVYIIVRNSSQNEESTIIPTQEEMKKDQDGYEIVDPYWWSSKLTDQELVDASEALSTGIKINDDQNDFYHPPEGTIQPDGMPDNPNPFPIPFTDLKSVSIGADDENLYIKYEYGGVFPDQAPTYQGEMIYDVGAKVAQMHYVTKSGIADQADVAGSVMLYDGDAKRTFAIGRLLNEYRITPTGNYDETGDETFERSGQDQGKIFGGSGYNYVLCMLPLSLFDIELGTEITFESGSEAHSASFHHEAIDNLGVGDLQFSPIFTHVLGSDSYQVSPNPWNDTRAE